MRPSLVTLQIVGGLAVVVSSILLAFGLSEGTWLAPFGLLLLTNSVLFAASVSLAGRARPVSHERRSRPTAVQPSRAASRDEGARPARQAS